MPYHADRTVQAWRGPPTYDLRPLRPSMLGRGGRSTGWSSRGRAERRKPRLVRYVRNSPLHVPPVGSGPNRLKMRRRANGRSRWRRGTRRAVRRWSAVARGVRRSRRRAGAELRGHGRADRDPGREAGRGRGPARRPGGGDAAQQPRLRPAAARDHPSRCGGGAAQPGVHGARVHVLPGGRRAPAAADAGQPVAGRGGCRRRHRHRGAWRGRRRRRPAGPASGRAAGDRPARRRPRRLPPPPPAPRCLAWPTSPAARRTCFGTGSR